MELKKISIAALKIGGAFGLIGVLLESGAYREKFINFMERQNQIISDYDELNERYKARIATLEAEVYALRKDTDESIHVLSAQVNGLNKTVNRHLISKTYDQVQDDRDY